LRLDGRALVESVLAQEPGLAAALPMGNEEADMVGGWNHQLPWHSDAFNAAGLVRLLAMHEDMINANQSLRAKNVRLGYHANDNAFLNYGDAWFMQRTLVTRFEMNLTHTVELVRKP
jgi:L-iduronidase